MGTALVTGASSGLGTEFCWQLATANHNLVLVARNEAALHDLAEKLHQVTGVRTEVIVADLAKAEDVERVAARLRQEENPVGLLVNNAGFGLAQEFIGGSLERELFALDVMVRAVLVLSHVAAEKMTKRGHGAILNVSSLAADTALGTYAAAKRWVLAFTEGLAGELRGTGVTATAVQPGLVNTNFAQVANMDVSYVPGPVFIPPEVVVEDALTAVRTGKVICVPTRRYRLANRALRLLPRRVVQTYMSGDLSGLKRRH